MPSQSTATFLTRGSQIRAARPLQPGPVYTTQEELNRHRASTFKKVLADFRHRLRSAEYVAIDTEFTGTDIAGDPNTFEGCAAVRLDKLCTTAEQCSLIRIGFTIVGRKRIDDGFIPCCTYSLFAFPYSGPELGGCERGFFCSVTALRTSVRRRLDFNRWVREGIPYMSREEEQRLLKTQSTQKENHVDEKVGLLLLWKALCAAQLPLVVHCPLDLFLLLASFERRPLPKNDLPALIQMIRKCSPQVYDTAQLHGALGRSKRLGLGRLFEDARKQYIEKRCRNLIPTVQFDYQGESAERYRGRPEDLPPEAGSASLVTAQLFTFLRTLNDAEVRRGVNKLFLYQTAHLDLEQAALEGEVGTSMFDLSRETLLVAAVDPLAGVDATSAISAANHTYKWMDDKHVLVVLRASGGSAVRKAADLATKVQGVVSWMAFEDWQALKKGVAKDSDAVKCTNHTHINGNTPAAAKTLSAQSASSEVPKGVVGRGVCAGVCLWPWGVGHSFISTTWVSRLLVFGTAGLFVVLATKTRAQSLSVFARSLLV